MPVAIRSPIAAEESTYVVTVVFTDDAGASATPDTMTWTLLDASGAVVNSRSSVALTPAATMTIVLSGDDLAIGTAANATRIILLQGTYTSSRGAGLPFRDTIAFSIQGLIGVL